MPVVRLAATGMDSYPASDEDTEDELESARQTSSSTRMKLLPSISRQLVRNGIEGFIEPNSHNLTNARLLCSIPGLFLSQIDAEVVPS